jgi:serine/threonine-protein kinase
MMSPANETTRFLAQGANGGDLPPDGHPGQSGSGEREGASAQRDVADSIVGSRVGAYLITKRIGSGGVGEVYKAMDVMLQREVAIKVLRDELASDAVFLKRFSNEAQFLAKLSHPNVASVHAFLNEGGKQFMVMEYVPGISLDEFVRSGGPLPVERALTIFRKALDGIAHAHAQGIVHRDIKPANIMLADSGQVKVMDFGIARALDSQEQLTRHGQVAGTAKAMAPEQIRGAQADVRSDIYSLGIVLYTLLAGRPPFVGEGDHALMLAQLEQAPPPLRSWIDNVPPKVEAAVMRALQKDPSARFQNVAAFAQAIDACQADLITVAPPAVDRLDAQTSSRTVINPVLQGVQRLPSSSAAGHRAQDPGGLRRKWPWVAAGAAALGVVALGVGVLLMPSPTPKPTVSNPTGPDPIAPPTAPIPAVTRTTVPNPTVDAVKPRTLAIVRLPSDGPATSAGVAAEVGAAGSAALNPFKPGELIRLRIAPSQDAHVYCYLQNETRRIVRFYPNRFNPSALVRADAPLEIPGTMRFELFANSLQVPETIACFASERDVAGTLPASVLGDDLTELPAASLDEVRQAFARAAAGEVAEGRFQILFK